jgi:uroporphyrin-III C-methyltransferase
MNNKNSRYPVSIVGTGTGDPELLTVKALKVIGKADVLIYDCREAEPAIRFAPLSAKVIYLSKILRAGEDAYHGCKSIVDLMGKYYHAGFKVVRLKPGDPMLFGGDVDEGLGLQQMTIPFEIVPGITAGVSAASTYALPISAKHQSNSVTYLIADEIRDDFELIRDSARLLRHGSTLVLYMATRNLAALFQVFAEEGVPETIPVVAVSKSGWPDESHAAATMKEIAGSVEFRKLKEPVTYFIGRHITIRTRPSDKKSRALNQHNFSCVQFF